MAEKQRILISGINRGIGRALTMRLLEDGHQVAGLNRRPSSATSFPIGNSESLKLLQGDIRDPGSCSAAIASLMETWDSIDILVNNAGVYPEDPDAVFEDVAKDDFRLAMETNFLGPVNLTRAALPLLRNAPAPKILFMGSGAGSITTKEDSRSYCYGTSKAALHMFARTLGYELKPPVWTVSVLSPGWIRTDMGGPNAELGIEDIIDPLTRTILSLNSTHHGQFINRFGENGHYQW